MPKRLGFITASLFSIFAWAGPLPAQTPEPGLRSAASLFVLSGFIVEKGFKVPVEGASLFLEPLVNNLHYPVASAAAPVSLSALTPAPSPTATPGFFSVNADLRGYYQISVLPGDYRLTVTGLGFKKQIIDRWAVNGDARKDFYLERDGFTLSEVVVTTPKNDPAQVSHEALSHEELTSVAGTMGGDVLRALQSLPGIVNAGILNGQLLVRGSGPDDNLYLVDRVPISFPYHFGIISTLDSNLINDIDFSAGGFGPSYTGVMGGVVDVDQRNPREDRWGFRADVNVALTELEAEGPLSSNSSLAIAVRRSYLELFPGLLASFGIKTAPIFDDYQVKYSYDPSPRVHWDFVALGSDDQFNYDIPTTITQQDPIFSGNLNYHQGYNSQGINYRQTDDAGNTFLNTLYHYNFFFDADLGLTLFDNTQIDDFGDWFTFQHNFDQDARLEAGVQYDHANNGIRAFLPTIPTEGQSPYVIYSLLNSVASNANTPSDKFGIYFNQKFKTLDKKLEISIGARADYFSNSSQMVLAPRISGAYLFSPDTTVNVSYGYYYEDPNRPDDGYFLEPGFGNPHLGPEESISTVLGIDQKLSRGLYFRVEGFNKEFSGLFVSNNQTNYDNNGLGYARGLEFFLRQAPTDRFFGWISYTLSDSRQQDGPGQPVYLFDYDEPNVLTAVGTYKLSPEWEAGLKWTYNTGFPYTPLLNPPATFNGTYNVFVPNPGAVNSARFPDYERLDFSLSWKQVYDTWVWRIYLDMFNLLNNQNILGYNYSLDYSQSSPVKDLPFFPFLGTEVKF